MITVCNKLPFPCSMPAAISQILFASSDFVRQLMIDLYRIKYNYYRYFVDLYECHKFHIYKYVVNVVMHEYRKWPNSGECPFYGAPLFVADLRKFLSTQSLGFGHSLTQNFKMMTRTKYTEQFKGAQMGK